MEKKILKAIMYAITFVFMLPVLYVIAKSLITEDGIGLSQYRTLYEGYPSFFRALGYSAVYAAAITAGGVLLSIPVAFLFAKGKFRGRDLLFFIYIIVMMLPVQSTILGQFLLLKSLGWLDHEAAIIFPLMLSPITVYLLRQNLKQIPQEQLEAAQLETGSVPVLLFQVILPQIRGILTAATVLLFCESWNIIEQAIILLPYNEEIKPLSVLLNRYPEDILAAGSMVYMSPVFVIFIFFGLYQIIVKTQKQQTRKGYHKVTKG